MLEAHSPHRPAARHEMTAYREGPRRPFVSRTPISVHALSLIGFLCILAGAVGVAYGIGITREDRTAASAGVGLAIVGWSVAVLSGGIFNMVIAHIAAAVVEMRDIARHQIGL